MGQFKFAESAINNSIEECNILTAQTYVIGF